MASAGPYANLHLDPDTCEMTSYCTVVHISACCESFCAILCSLITTSGLVPRLEMRSSESIFGQFCAILPQLGSKWRLKLLPVLTLYFDFSHPVSYQKVHFSCLSAGIRPLHSSHPCIKQLQTAKWRTPVLIMGQKNYFARKH